MNEFRNSRSKKYIFLYPHNLGYNNQFEEFVDSNSFQRQDKTRLCINKANIIIQ